MNEKETLLELAEAILSFERGEYSKEILVQIAKVILENIKN